MPSCYCRSRHAGRRPDALFWVPAAKRALEGVHAFGDPEREWIVIGQGHRRVMLDRGLNFFEWAHEHWPAPRWTVELDLWQLDRTFGW